ncbi:MAG: family 20 glycosylhydrolase [Fimbriimonas sp.]
MSLRMWTYDLAREQSPSYDQLSNFCTLSLDAGYSAFGIYMEHRFAFPSIPWVHGEGSVTAETIKRLQKEFPSLQIIPFINLLGHMEGFLYTEEGQQFAESRFEGMQACPSNPHFFKLCEKIVDDTLSVFDSEIIHLGGDETWQLGQCPKCSARVAQFEKVAGIDGKAQIYGEHFGVLAKTVSAAGRRPAVWGDMFLTHPTALDLMPKNTLIFDWQYFNGPSETSRLFIDKGFEVVFCPTLHTYNATWLHLPQSEQNVRQHAKAAHEMNAYGVCVTTWECGLMGNYETILPAIKGAGRLLQNPGSSPDTTDYKELREAPVFLKAYLDQSERYEEWARLLGCELQDAGGMFEFTGIRSSLKARLLLYSNPFLLWLRNCEDLCGEPGDKALDIFQRAIAFAPDASSRGIAEFGRGAIEFVRFAEAAHKAYAEGEVGKAIAAITPARQTFENLGRTAKATHYRGGSAADIERCRIAREHVDLVIRRIKQYGDGSLGYIPSFEMLTHPKFVPHDQAGWWLINRWANE